MGNLSFRENFIISKIPRDFVGYIQEDVARDVLDERGGDFDEFVPVFVEDPIRCLT